MPTTQPPAFSSIADDDVKRAFVGGGPEIVAWLDAGTKLFKWAQSITTPRGISAWWQLLESRRLGSGVFCPGIQEFQEYAARLDIHERDYARVRTAVTEEWNKMTTPVAIELATGAWGYIGKAAGQLRTLADPKVFFIGGEYQVWVPGLIANDIRHISLLPYLLPNSPFHPR